MTDEQRLFVSYSANREDVMLNRVFGAQTDGFFVDVGAAHPLFENDTRALYDRGWRGINIEPTPHFYRDLAAQRPRDINLNVAVSDEPGDLPFHEIVGTGLSTANGEYAARAAARGFEVVDYGVRTLTLRDILQEAHAPEIDVLKVDVEGFELKVMRSNDWARFRPRIILAEATVPDSPVRRHDGVPEYLAEQGYRHVYFDGLNDFFSEQSFVVAADVFDRPINVFDRFVPFAQHQLAVANAALTAEIERVRQDLQSEQENAATYIASLNTEIASLNTELSRVSLIAKAHAIDLGRAHAELIAMRERGQALAAELEAAAMSKLRAERDAQWLMTAKARTDVEAQRVIQQLQDVYASTSWRVSRPLRALARPRRTIGFVLRKLHLS